MLSAVSAGFIPAVGSSRSRSWGSDPNARAISSLRRIRIRQVHGVLVGHGQEAVAEDSQKVSRLLSQRRFLSTLAGRVEKGAHDPGLQTAMHPDENVLQDAEIRKDSDVLKRPRDAPRRDRIGREPSHILSLEEQPPPGRTIHAAENVEQRGLPAPLGPITLMISPGSTARSTSSRAFRPPKFIVRRSMFKRATAHSTREAASFSASRSSTGSRSARSSRRRSLLPMIPSGRKIIIRMRIRENAVIR